MANLAQENQLYEETFKINGINAEKYDRVSRLSCLSTDGATELELDINHELFPCQVGETLHVVLATSLSLDGRVIGREAALTGIKARLSDAPQTLVRLNAHRDASLENLLPLAAALESLGARDVVLVVTPGAP